MKEFKKPDLNAPRFRPKKQSILNSAFYKRFIKAYPKYKDITPDQVKAIIKAYNGKIWQTVIDNREGIQLPEQLGYIFLGSAPKKIGDNIDYKKSIEVGYKVQNKNWESDEYLAKIFYTNYESKYRFRFHELWSFTALRDFKRSVAKIYPHQWKNYIVIDNNQKISKLFRKQVYKSIVEKEVVSQLETYDEFDFS